jgi:phage terminase large subunit-like protein
LYEQGRVHHIGAFSQLEDQMCAFTVEFDRKNAGHSPDRVDGFGMGAERSADRASGI